MRACIIVSLVWSRQIVLTDLGVAWLQVICSSVMPPWERSSVSRRPSVGSVAAPHSASHYCRWKGFSSCPHHCYKRGQLRHRHLINESSITLLQHSQAAFYNAATKVQYHFPVLSTHTNERLQILCYILKWWEAFKVNLLKINNVPGNEPADTMLRQQKQ